MRRSVLVAVVCLLTGPAGALSGEDKSERSSTRAAIEARLVANKNTYVLDPAHRGEAFRRRLAPGRVPAAIKKLPISEDQRTQLQRQIKEIQAAGDDARIIATPAPAITVAGRAGSVGRVNVPVLVIRRPRQPPPSPPAVEMTLELHNAGDGELTVSVGGDDSVLRLKLAGPGAVTTKPRKEDAAVGVRPGRQVTIAPGAKHVIPIKRLQHGELELVRSYWTEPGEYTVSATYQTIVRSASGSATETVKVKTSPVKIKVIEPASAPGPLQTSSPADGAAR